MSDTWFYTTNGKTRIGPLPLVAMRLLLQGGAIQPTHHVLRPGETRWVRADTVAELSGVADVLPAEEEAVPTLEEVTSLRPGDSRLTGTWAGVVVNDQGQAENEAFIFSASGNPIHGYEGQDGRPVFVEVTHVGQVIVHAGPRRAGRLTVQALRVTPTAVAWQAQDSWLKSGGLATPGSFVTDRSGNDVVTWEAALRGEELDVQTVCRMQTSSTDNIRDFGGGGGTFNFDNSATIWKRGTLRKISDDPNHLLRRFQ